MGLTLEDGSDSVSLPPVPKLKGVEGGRIAATGAEMEGIGCTSSTKGEE
jgi:hypothetical protein